MVFTTRRLASARPYIRALTVSICAVLRSVMTDKWPSGLMGGDSRGRRGHGENSVAQHSPDCGDTTLLRRWRREKRGDKEKQRTRVYKPGLNGSRGRKNVRVNPGRYGKNTNAFKTRITFLRFPSFVRIVLMIPHSALPPHPQWLRASQFCNMMTG